MALSAQSPKPFDQDQAPPLDDFLFGPPAELPPERVPSGFVWMDGRWTDPKDLELVTVLRDGFQIRRRPQDLLPYDELVSL